MPLSLEQALLIGQLANTGANLAGGIMGSRAASNAANAQTAAADQAARIQAQSAQQALQLQAQMYNDQVNRQLPWYDAGRSALGGLTGLMGLKVNPSAPSNIKPPMMNFGGGGFGGPGGASFNPTLNGGGNGGGNPGGSNWGRNALTAGSLALSTLPLFVKGGAAAGGAAAGAGAAGAGGSGGFGATMGALASNPITWAVAGGLLAGGAWLKSQAHHEANTIVKNLENPFHFDFLAPLSAEFARLQSSGQLDPQTAQQYIDALDQNWSMYQNEANKYAQGGSDEKKVSGQSIANVRPTVEKMRQDMMAALQSLNPQQSPQPQSDAMAAPPDAIPVGAGQTPLAATQRPGLSQIYRSRYRRPY